MSSNSGGPSPWGTPGGGSGGNGAAPTRWRRSVGTWRRGPGGPFGPRPGRRSAPGPDLDQIIARMQALVRSWLGGGSGGPRSRFTGGRGIALIGMGVLVLWLASGIYRVQPDEVGAVLTFGRYTRLTQPGLHYHLPWPIEKVLLPAVTRINRTEIGFRSGVAQWRRRRARCAVGKPDADRRREHHRHQPDGVLEDQGRPAGLSVQHARPGQSGQGDRREFGPRSRSAARRSSPH